MATRSYFSTMNSASFRVPFGLKDGKIVPPSPALEGGLACGCVCPGCGTQLIIRQGKKRRHFAHYLRAPNADCVETAIHAAAIQILTEEMRFAAPAYFVRENVPIPGTSISHAGSDVVSE